MTVLATAGEWGLIGDTRGLIYAMPTAEIRERTERGEPIRSSAKRVAMDRVHGAQGSVPMLLAQHEGVSVLAAFAGSWYVKYQG